MQHPRPIGPIDTTVVATFEPSMSQGCRPPDRSHFYTPVHRLGQQLSPITPVQAVFTPSMSQGTRPPEQSHFYTPVFRLGQQLSQTTHVAAVFQPSMSQGVTAPEQRYIAPLHTGWSVQAPDVAVVVAVNFEPVTLSPEQRYSAPFHQGWSVSQPTHTAAPFEPAMVAGSQPPKNRAFTFPKIGGSVSQTTHDEARFSIEMSVGVTAPQSRYIAPRHTGWSWLSIEVPVFSTEMIVGARPEKGRILLGARIGLPVSQTTHTSAAFSTEMSQGARPMERSHFKPAQTGWSLSQLGTLATPIVTGKVFTVPGHRRGYTVTAHARAFHWSGR